MVMASSQATVQLPMFLKKRVEREPLSSDFCCTLAQSTAEFVISNEEFDPLGVCIECKRVEHETVPLLRDGFSGTVLIADEDRDSAGHGLQRGQWNSFAPGRPTIGYQGEERRGAIYIREVVVRDGSREDDLAAQAAGCDVTLKIGTQVPI